MGIHCTCQNTSALRWHVMEVKTETNDSCDECTERSWVSLNISQERDQEAKQRKLIDIYAVISCYFYITDKLQGVQVAGHCSLREPVSTANIRDLHRFLERGHGELTRQQERGTSLLCITPVEWSKSWLGWISKSEVCTPIISSKSYSNCCVFEDSLPLDTEEKVSFIQK